MSARQQIRQIYNQLPEIYDPWRRLLAAVTLRSVLDIRQPTRTMTQDDYDSAQQFVRDRFVRSLLNEMKVSVPWQQIEKMIAEQSL